MSLDSIITKTNDAKAILSECIGKDGMWADGTTDGYKDVYFTRDLAIALEGFPFQKTEEIIMFVLAKP